MYTSSEENISRTGKWQCSAKQDNSVTTLPVFWQLNGFNLKVPFITISWARPCYDAAVSRSSSTVTNPGGLAVTKSGVRGSLLPN